MLGAQSHGLKTRGAVLPAALRARSAVLLVASWLSGVGCGSLPSLPTRPAAADTMVSVGLADDQPPNGALRPGDEVIVESGTEEERRQVRARVDARGTLHVDSEQDVAVGGLSLDQAEARVTEQLRARDKFADVTLLLANRASQRVTALGALARPGWVDAAPAMRLSDLVAAAGGILFLADVGGAPAVEIADLDRSVLVRDGTALPIRMRDALQAKPGHDVYVHPGDLLYVPFATENTVSVLGQVGGPRVLPHHSGMRLTEALASAGGVADGGDNGDIRVVRGPPHAPRAYQASLAAIADGDQGDSLLLPGDVVFVEDSFIEDAGEVFELVGPFASLALLVLSVVVITSP